MSQTQWTEVDNYFAEMFAPPDDALNAAVQSKIAAGLPLIHVPPNLGKLLHLLARSHNARRILEIGTLAGYSTIWLARALPDDGKLITLELEAERAAIARENIERAGLADRVEVRVGPAAGSLAALVDAKAEPFDLVFIDADKASTPDYLAWSLQLTRPGSLIIIDNIVRNGAVSNPDSEDPNVQGVRRALAALAENPRIIATALQTVGSKGYDGFAIALVTGD